MMPPDAGDHLQSIDHAQQSLPSIQNAHIIVCICCSFSFDVTNLAAAHAQMLAKVLTFFSATGKGTTEPIHHAG